MVLKRIAALFLAAGSFGLVAAAPLVTMQSIPTVACEAPLRILYEKRINANGTIEARNTKEVYLETPIIARAVNVSVGDYVKKGDVLAVIDRELTKSVLEQSVPAAALIGKLPNAQDAADLIGLYSALQSSGLGEGFGPIDELVDAYAPIADASTRQNEYLYIPETVVAPMDGIVTDVGLQSDMLSRTAKPAVTISDTGNFVAMVTVGESYVSDIKVGDEALITGTGFSDKTYQGHVSKIYPIARRSSGTTAQETVVDLEITIDQPDEALKAGFTARAEIVTDTRKHMLTVPYEAVLQDENNVEYVYVAQGSRAVRRDIKTGLELLEGVEVLEGLDAEDSVISSAAAVNGGESLINLKKG